MVQQHECLPRCSCPSLEYPRAHRRRNSAIDAGLPAFQDVLNMYSIPRSSAREWARFCRIKSSRALRFHKGDGKLRFLKYPFMKRLYRASPLAENKCTAVAELSLSLWFESIAMVPFRYHRN